MSGKIGGAGSKSGVIGTTELDYEEGTWTPQVYAGSSTMSTATGNDSPEATYTRTGNLVYLTINLWGLPVGSSSGALQIRNLPFTSAEHAVFSVRQEYYPKAYEIVPVYYLSPSSTSIIIYDAGGGSAWLTDATVANILTGNFFARIAGTYKVQ